MKRIISSIILAVFFFIGLGHSSMMVFADHSMGQMLHSQENTSKKKCQYSCCMEQFRDQGAVSIIHVIKKQCQKIDAFSCSGDITFSKTLLFENKNLFFQTSPPYLDRDIENYSYHTLIQIIKSNT